MPDKHKYRCKSSSGKATEAYEDVELVSGNLISELFQSQERLLKSFAEIAGNLNKRIDVLVSQVADLRVSLEFSQRDIAQHKTMIEMIDVKLQSNAAEINTIQPLEQSNLRK